MEEDYRKECEKREADQLEEEQAELAYLLKREHELFLIYGIDIFACDCLSLTNLELALDGYDDAVPYLERPISEGLTGSVDSVYQPSGCLSLDAIQDIVKAGLPPEEEEDPGPTELGDGESIL